jgi:hypothetical protein
MPGGRAAIPVALSPVSNFERLVNRLNFNIFCLPSSNLSYKILIRTRAKSVDFSCWLLHRQNWFCGSQPFNADPDQNPTFNLDTIRIRR